MTINPQEVLRDDVEVRTALISVFDKTGVVEFARELDKRGVNIISTGGTAKAIRDAGIPVTDVTEVTGFPEILDGRVKTLHPVIHAGILANKANPDHMRVLAEHNITPIDMVVVNLYPFQQVARKPDVTESQLVENIDVGGPTLLRAAAKNFGSVAVVSSPEHYERIIGELDRTGGKLSYETRWMLMRAAFRVLSTDSTAVDTRFGLSTVDSDERARKAKSTSK